MVSMSKSSKLRIRGLQLVVPQNFSSIEELRGKTMVVRDRGRPYAITLWLKEMGLEKDVKTIIVKDKEIGRWKQWKKVISGECAACFVAPIYLPSMISRAAQHAVLLHCVLCG
jgi:hypothetical protein